MENKNNAPYGWNDLNDIPPNEMVEVIDKDHNRARANPTYYPFEVLVTEGDKRKPWGWRGTPVFFEDGQHRWDGGWLINTGLDAVQIGDIIGWRLLKT